jgi:hypothetical protein
MNANMIIGLLCLDDAFRDTFFKNGASGFEEALKPVPLLLSWSEKKGLMALADAGMDPNSEVRKAFNAMAATMRKVGCPNPPCLYLFVTTVIQPTFPLPPPPPDPTMAQQK